MENNSFRKFLDSYLEIWRNSSLTDMKNIISEDYRAREISDGEVLDFGYEESVSGWEQGFAFAKKAENEWDLKEISVVPLRQDEVMAILAATLVIDGKKLDNVSLFFKTLESKKTTIGN